MYAEATRTRTDPGITFGTSTVSMERGLSKEMILAAFMSKMYHCLGHPSIGSSENYGKRKLGIIVQLESRSELPAREGVHGMHLNVIQHL